jgi:protein-tyrosine-phosphatase
MMATLVRSVRFGPTGAKLGVIALCLLGSRGPTTSAASPQMTRFPDAGIAEQKQATVLFMCSHGAAKSVLASAYFQRIAKERGLNVRVEAAGIEPQEAVSSTVAAHLQKNGYTVPVTKPRAVTQKDLNDADVVISMGCDLSRLPVAPRAVQKWDDVPGPSEDLKGADAAIRRRVIALVEEMLARQHK